MSTTEMMKKIVRKKSFTYVHAVMVLAKEWLMDQSALYVMVKAKFMEVEYDELDWKVSILFDGLVVIEDKFRSEYDALNWLDKVKGWIK